MMYRRDTEKSWHDPRAYRRAAGYVAVIVLACAAAVAVIVATAQRPCADGAWVCETRDRYLLIFLPAGLLLLGGFGALGWTYRAWRAGGTWPIWQGAGWFLLTVALAYGAIAGGLSGR
ncbi:hypothetical protein [Speluncibacter jeojiensis]|uniref:hypothetical protein n=1 Tax=Speluncibacter jeojiensis TaxID=2710754 RepID=UPI00241028E4|nr:hypothetical protein [Rhodococcus sp. D2-41]